MDAFVDLFESVVGAGSEDLSVWNVAARAFLVYIGALALVRLGEKRFIGKFAAFDVILGFMLGSILSSAITGSSGFVPMLTGALMLVVLHYVFAVLAFYWDWFGTLVKGNARTLVENGTIDWSAMKRSHISRKDLLGALRENSGMDDLGKVRLAQLERSGNVSVVRRDE